MILERTKAAKETAKVFYKAADRMELQREILKPVYNIKGK